VDGANRPSIKLSDLTTNGGIHATHNIAEKGKKGSVERVEKRSACDGDHKREPQNPGTIGSSEHRRRRVTFVLDFFLYQEKESNLRP
jgi:hypothetical protein